MGPIFKNTALLAVSSDIFVAGISITSSASRKRFLQQEKTNRWIDDPDGQIPTGAKLLCKAEADESNWGADKEYPTLDLSIRYKGEKEEVALKQGHKLDSGSQWQVVDFLDGAAVPDGKEVEYVKLEFKNDLNKRGKDRNVWCEVGTDLMDKKGGSGRKDRRWQPVYFPRAGGKWGAAEYDTWKADASSRWGKPSWKCGHDNVAEGENFGICKAVRQGRFSKAGVYFLRPTCKNSLARHDYLSGDECKDPAVLPTAEPPTEEPPTEEPPTEEPPTEEPPTEEPPTEEPPTEEPPTEEPPTEEPPTEEPPTDEPPTDEPPTEEPPTEEPPTEEPPTEEPPTEEPPTETPPSGPVVRIFSGDYFAEQAPGGAKVKGGNEAQFPVGKYKTIEAKYSVTKNPLKPNTATTMIVPAGMKVKCYAEKGFKGKSHTFKGPLEVTRQIFHKKLGSDKLDSLKVLKVA